MKVRVSPRWYTERNVASRRFVGALIAVDRCNACFTNRTLFAVIADRHIDSHFYCSFLLSLKIKNYNILSRGINNPLERGEKDQTTRTRQPREHEANRKEIYRFPHVIERNFVLALLPLFAKRFEKVYKEGQLPSAYMLAQDILN